MSDITTQHKDYIAKLKEWQRADDITRQKNVTSYLVWLNPLDKSEENTKRNEQYRERAIFYALASQTVTGMLGTVFKEWPTLTIPEVLDYLKINCDGAGVSIYQQSQAAADAVIRKARCGLYVSFPRTYGEVSQGQIQSGEVAARIHLYEPEQIINWRLVPQGNSTRLGLVVLKSGEEVPDGYDVGTVDVYRELYLNDMGFCVEREWREKEGTLEAGEEIYPTDFAGKKLTEIPFTFVGAESNDSSVDDSRISGIIELNIGHYRNSADYEDTIFYSGQAQPWMSGITQDHINTLKANNMYVGSRNLLGVPEGGSFGFASAPPNPLVRQAMLDKVDQMVSLGARMMQQGSATKTATQAAGEMEVQHSVLSLIASNVSEAYTRCLYWAMQYMGALPSGEELAYTLRQDFTDIELSYDKLREMMHGFLAGSIPTEDYIRFMKDQGVFDKEKAEEDYVAALGKRNNRADGINRFAIDDEGGE